MVRDGWDAAEPSLPALKTDIEFAKVGEVSLTLDAFVPEGRDLTDSFHRDPGHHFEGLDRIMAHVEKYWSSTITSECLTGQPAFRFVQANAVAGDGDRSK